MLLAASALFRVPAGRLRTMPNRGMWSRSSLPLFLPFRRLLSSQSLGPSVSAPEDWLAQVRASHPPPEKYIGDATAAGVFKRMNEIGTHR